jgi:PhnB protein
MRIEAYLFFNGRCEEAIEFYGRTLGAEVQMLMRNRDAANKPPPGMLPPGSDDKIMHANLRVGSSILMVSDGRCDGRPEFKGFALSLDAATEAEAERMFNALADGGAVQMPLARTFWSPKFGMVADRFGVGWMVSVVPA